MSILVLSQVAINVALFLAVWVLWTKLRKPPKDDPRLSRGLQLLQSKIAVLEDLSDKTDHQVNQIVVVLDRKCKELQGKVQEASSEIGRVEHSIQRSLEVSEIFEDRIPHSEIIERQKTKSYVLAAQLAHKGASASEIAQQVDIPQSEIELIMKVNKDKLMFSQEHLPAWANGGKVDQIDFKMESQNFKEPKTDDSVVFKPLIERPRSLEKIGEQFRQACEQVEQDRVEAEKPTAVESMVDQVIQQVGGATKNSVSSLRQFSEDAVQKVGEGIYDALQTEIREEKLDQPLVEAVTEERVEPVRTEPVRTEPARTEPVRAKAPEPVPTIEVIRKNTAPDSRKVTEKAQVVANDVKRVQFPTIGLTEEVR